MQLFKLLEKYYFLKCQMFIWQMKSSSLASDFQGIYSSFVGLNQNGQTDVKNIRTDWVQMFQLVRFFSDLEFIFFKVNNIITANNRIPVLQISFPPIVNPRKTCFTVAFPPEGKLPYSSFPRSKVSLSRILTVRIEINV